MPPPTSDHRLAVQVARELSSPEPAVHFGLTLVVATLVASPVLGAAALGHQAVPAALLLYLGVLVIAWLLVGLVGGALAMFGRSALLSEHRSIVHAEAGREPSPSPTAGASTPDRAESVGSNGAH